MNKVEESFLKSIETIRIDDWAELEKHDLPKWIFRGQRDHRWDFKSSLERLCASMGIDSSDSHIVEKSIASEFKRRFHQYSNHIPEKGDNLEWLSIMRHYMAPTRLLDWNYSIYVALYFSLENKCDKSGNGSAVWCLNKQWAHEKSKNRYLLAGKRKEDVENICDKPSYGQNIEAFTRMFLSEPFIDTVLPISPRNITQRITAQKGLFLCPGNPNRKFVENIQAMNDFKDKDNIIKLLIPNAKRKEYLAKLFGMNITHTTLFPGLDGFAYSLAVYHHSYEIENLQESQHRDDDSVWNIHR